MYIIHVYLFDISTEGSIDSLLMSTVARLRERGKWNNDILLVHTSQAYIFSHFPAGDLPQISSEVTLHGFKLLPLHIYKPHKLYQIKIGVRYKVTVIIQ